MHVHPARHEKKKKEKNHLKDTNIFPVTPSLNVLAGARCYAVMSCLCLWLRAL